MWRAHEDDPTSQLGGEDVIFRIEHIVFDGGDLWVSLTNMVSAGPLTDGRTIVRRRPGSWCRVELSDDTVVMTVSAMRSAALVLDDHTLTIHGEQVRVVSGPDHRGDVLLETGELIRIDREPHGYSAKEFLPAA